jgi:hypothetical protein
MDQNETTTRAGSPCRELFAFAEVHPDPMAFAMKGAIFRGYYIVSRGVNYMTKEGLWTHGCTATDDGNWWDTHPQAERALAKFREANSELSQPPVE